MMKVYIWKRFSYGNSTYAAIRRKLQVVKEIILESVEKMPFSRPTKLDHCKTNMRESYGHRQEPDCKPPLRGKRTIPILVWDDLRMTLQAEVGNWCLFSNNILITVQVLCYHLTYIRIYGMTSVVPFTYIYIMDLHCNQSLYSSLDPCQWPSYFNIMISIFW